MRILPNRLPPTTIAITSPALGAQHRMSTSVQACPSLSVRRRNQVPAQFDSLSNELPPTEMPSRLPTLLLHRGVRGLFKSHT